MILESCIVEWAYSALSTTFDESCSIHVVRGYLLFLRALMLLHRGARVAIMAILMLQGHRAIHNVNSRQWKYVSILHFRGHLAVFGR